MGSSVVLHTLHQRGVSTTRLRLPQVVLSGVVLMYGEKNNRRISGITPGCMDVLLHYPWPGNVRELENAMERGVILMRGDYLDEESLPIPIQKWAREGSDDITADLEGLPSSLEEAEKLVILKILDEVDGNKSEAARRLGITRKTLLSKLNKYGKG